MSALRVGADVAATLRGWAQSARPNEACGLLLGEPVGPDWVVRSALRSPNLAPAPRRAFLLSPSLLLEYGQRADLLAVWHSHPAGGAELSSQDRDGALAWPGLLQVLVVEGALRAWGPGPLRPPLVCVVESAPP